MESKGINGKILKPAQKKTFFQINAKLFRISKE